MIANATYGIQNDTGLSYFYPVFFPPNVDIVGADGTYSDQAWCGIHGAFNSTTTNATGTIIYSEEPYTISGCYKGEYPQYYAVAAYGQGAQDADSAVSTLSHELDESITDPGANNSYGWYDSSGHEIGDECSGIFGPPLGSTDSSNAQQSEYNQVINGHDYWTQETFSNATFAAFKTGQGCVQKAFVPQGAENATQPTEDLATGTVNASPLSLPADGASTSTVTDTVTYQDGEPVVGDEVDFSVDASDGSTGVCGTLSGGDNSTDGQKADGNVGGMTDANGQISVTYTASTDSASCDISAVEAEGGTSDVVTVTQGADTMQAPSIAVTGLPTTLTLGANPVTFTTTITNPGSADIAGALQTIYLAGDNAGTTGLDANQVTLSYANDSTGGQFVSVPLGGTTLNDGYISGTTQPASGGLLAAGASQTTTWQLSLAASAPTSAATDALYIEADLDSIDPASGAATNLDYDNGHATVLAAPTTTTTTSTTGPITTTTTATITTTTTTTSTTTTATSPTTIVEPTTTVIEPGKTVIQEVPEVPAKCTVPKLVGDSPLTAKSKL